MKTFILHSVIAALTIVTASCADEKNMPPHRSETITIQTEENQWTYLRLETGQTVGTSRVGDQEADREWNRRTDWDIAICNGMIRTNSGTSGCGNGGIQITDLPFEQIEEAPASGYETDTDNIEVW